MFEAPTIPAEAIGRGFVQMCGTELPIGCHPFVIDGIVDQWPAMTRWTPERLTATYGDEVVTCFAAPRAEGNFLQQTSTRLRMPFADFVRHTFSGEETDQLYYLRIEMDDDAFEQLRHDFEIPPILDRYQPAATGIWIGQRGNVTPFHHDWWHSCLAQVRGRKRYWLIHPMETKILQADWTSAARYDLEPAPPFDPETAGNFSMGFTGVLEAGQMLYIPPFWMHQIDTLENGNISMPIRFDTTQSPDPDLFQLSQDSLLRNLTNHPVSDAQTLIAVLRENNSRFAQLTREFVEAFCRVRDVEMAPSDITAELGLSATPDPANG